MVTPPIAGLDLARTQAFQMFAKGLPNQTGTVYPRPFGRSIRGPKQLRIQHYLNGFHIVEDSQQSDPQSTGPGTSRPGNLRRRLLLADYNDAVGVVNT